MSKHKDKLEYKEYINQLSPDEKKWIKQFYQEFEFGKVYKEPILDSQEVHKKSYSRRFDVHDAKSVTGLQDDTRQFMEDASNEFDKDGYPLDWQAAYKLGGYRGAVTFLITEAVSDLQSIDKATVLIRFHRTMCNLAKYNRKAYKGKKNGV